MPPISAANPNELLCQLAQLDISVPVRTEGRTTEHVERWSAARFLSSYARSSLIKYPLKVITRDRPDLLLSMPDSRVGIELTEAVPTNWARTSALHGHRGYENVMFIPHCAPGEPPRSTEELDRIARGEQASPPWMGDAPEQEWADVMLHFAKEKAGKLNKAGFSRFDQDWVLIYDGWPLPDVDEQLAASFLRDKLTNEPSTLPFQVIFVEGNKYFWQFAKDQVTRAVINDIWRGSQQHASVNR